MSTSFASSQKTTTKKKKLVIKSFSLGVTQPSADYEERTWAQLSAAVSAVHAQQPVPTSLQSLYQSVQNLCMAGAAARTFERLRAQCDAHCLAQLRALSAVGGSGSIPDGTADISDISAAISGERAAVVGFLERVNHCWQAYCRDMRMIRSVFLYLDRTYVLQQTKVRSLWDMGLQLFAENLHRCEKFAPRLVTSLLVVVQMERDGESTDLTLLHSLVGMLRELGLYKALFEAPFLRTTDRYYLAESKKRTADVESLDGAVYLHHVSSRLSQEHERVLQYLAPSTRPVG
jgi:cullin 4